MSASLNGASGSVDTDELSMESVFATEAPVLMDLVGLSGGYPTWADVDLFGTAGLSGGGGDGHHVHPDGGADGGILTSSPLAPYHNPHQQHSHENQEIGSPQSHPPNGWHANQALPSSYM